MNDEEIGRHLAILEKKISAKKTILKEVLKTIENEDGKAESLKNRKYITDMLHCSVSYPSPENECFTSEFLESFLFEKHVIAKIRILNRLPDRDLTFRLSLFPSLSSIRYNLFENDANIHNILAVRKNSSAILVVAIPQSAFFENERNSLILNSEAVPSKSDLLSPAISCLLSRNQSKSCTTATESIQIDFSTSLEVLDFKSIEFVDENQCLKIMQSMLTVFHRISVETPVEMSVIRREFPLFSCVDFDTWHLMVGSGLLAGNFIQISSDNRIQLLGPDKDTTFKFWKHFETKCTAKL